MGRIEWASAARILAWVLGVSFVLGAVLQQVLRPISGQVRSDELGGGGAL